MNNEYNNKLDNFVMTDVKKITNPVILEFGVRHGLSTKKFLEICEKNDGKLFSVDIDDCSQVSNNSRWKFIQSRDDNFNFIEKEIPNTFDVIMIDSFHNAKHVKKILFYYYQKLRIGGHMFIDDICWIPYVKNNYRNHFNSEINNRETFKMVTELILSNQENLNVYFSFVGSGMAKIIKLNEKELIEPKNIKSREISIKNSLRKILKK